MSYLKSLALAGLVVASVAALPATADAQSRGRGRAVPRGTAVPRSGPTRVVRAAPYRPYYYRPSYYRPGIGLSFYYGYGGFYGPYAYAPFGYGAYGYGPYAYGPYAYGPYGYGPYGYGGGYYGPSYGGVRLDLPQRDAEVFVDGYYTGIVDDFDGVAQEARLEPGPHRIEIRQPGFETISFDVNVEPGRTIRYRASMRPSQP